MKAFTKNTMFLLEQLGNKRRMKNLTQVQVARMLNTDRVYISQVENLHKGCSLDYYVKWANALGYMVTLVKKDSVL